MSLNESQKIVREAWWNAGGGGGNVGVGGVYFMLLGNWDKLSTCVAFPTLQEMLINVHVR